MSELVQIDAECPQCNGSGSGGFTSDCCGMVHELGYCAGHCAVPVPQPCDFCGGYGRVPDYVEVSDLTPARQPCDQCGTPVPVYAVSPSECFCSAECMEAMQQRFAALAANSPLSFGESGAGNGKL